MSRLIDPNHIGRQRTQMTKAIMLTLRELAPRQTVDDEARDMVAFIALCLHEINEGLTLTTHAWEKRNYWVKADQFMREWSWTGELSKQLKWALLHNDWSEIAFLIPQIASRLSSVKLPQRNTIGQAWHGAFARLKELGSTAPN